MTDLGRFAIHTSRKRMIEVQKELHGENFKYRPFDVYNLGRYERQWWQTKTLKGAEESHRELVLRFFRAETLENSPSSLLHARKGAAFVHVSGIDSTFTRMIGLEVAAAVKRVNGREVHCLAWDFEMDVRQEMLAVAEEQGVKVRLHRIPREIMEMNPSENPPFFELGLLKARHVSKQGKGAKLFDIELIDFIPALAEAPNKEIDALQERALKNGFDFIDFWAVDFDWAPGKPFNHDWQDYRTRKDRKLKTTSDLGYQYKGKKKRCACVKVVDVLGCDTSILLEIVP